MIKMRSAILLIASAHRSVLSSASITLVTKLVNRVRVFAWTMQRGEGSVISPPEPFAKFMVLSSSALLENPAAPAFFVVCRDWDRMIVIHGKGLVRRI